MKYSLVNSRKKWVLIVPLVVIILGACVGGIYAYLTDSDEVVNEITIGGVNVGVIEDFQPPKGLKPGTSFIKDVKVENKGPSDCYVRIKAVFTDSVMGDNCTVDWNIEDKEYNEENGEWVDKGDGYWYFTEPLEVGDVTESLFKNVKVSDDIDPSIIKDFDILVYAEAYQSDGFKNYTEAWAHYHRNSPAN